jgi:uncharacterized protein YecE (DUF72 family)
MTGKIRVGIGGWTFEPWRGVFYPDGLTQKRELEFASRKLTSIEINSTFYGAQKPDSFSKWRDETPDDFVFAIKGPRYATHRRVLAEGRESIDRFFAGGVMNLRDKLGPINWQFAPTKTFDAKDFSAFLDLLPSEVDGRTINHALEVRHESFESAEFVDLARARQVAIVVAVDSKYPEIADVSAPFVYVRLMGASETQRLGYSARALDAWAGHARSWAEGSAPPGLASLLASPKPARGRDVFLFAISGFKQKNPQVAMGLIERLA